MTAKLPILAAVTVNMHFISIAIKLGYILIYRFLLDGAWKIKIQTPELPLIISPVDNAIALLYIIYNALNFLVV